MDEERIPLFQNSTHHYNSSETSTTSTASLASVKIPIYGTNWSILGKNPSSNQRVVYTWNEINVFANIRSGSKSKKLFWRRDLTGNAKKHILKNVSGVAFPGELLAILGSSGAGKTTLLNALTFQSSSSVVVSGIRAINGIPVTSKTLTSQSAYVQQEDLFIGSLTIKEHLIFQALVRMDRGVSYERRMQRVDEVITELSLTKCQNTQIGIIGRIKGVSGGERKRLAFAAEVLTNPKLLICDEPTSGLDSAMALNVVQVLKNMAMKGKTIICTIHQPSSELYSMFDKLLLMAEGRTAFLGSPEEAEHFFKELQAPCSKNYNPADYFIQLLAVVPEKEESSRQAINLICDKYQRSDIGVRTALEAANIDESNHNDIWFNGEYSRSPYKASWFSQFRALLWRSWLSIIKEPLVIKIRTLQTIIIAAIVGIIYFGQKLDEDGVMNINGVLFIFLTNMTFQNVFAVVTVFCSELPTFLREHRNGMYRTDVYFLSKTFAETPIFIAIPLIFTSVCYFMIGLNSQDLRFWTTCGIVVLVAHVSCSFGYLISCVASSVSMALSVGPPLLIPFLLFGGFFLNVSSIPSYFNWLSYLSWFRFGNEALMINQWYNVTDIECTSVNSTCPKDGHVVLENYSFQEEDFNFDIIMLVVLILVFRIVAYCALLLKTF